MNPRGRPVPPSLHQFAIHVFVSLIRSSLVQSFLTKKLALSRPMSFIFLGHPEDLDNNSPVIPLNGAAWLVRQLMKISEQKSGDICCGGIIIWLITKSHLSLVIPQDTSIAEGSVRLDLDSLERVNMIRPKVEGRYTWLHGRHHESLGTLPDPQRTQVSPTTDWSFPDHVAATAGAGSQVE